MQLLRECFLYVNPNPLWAAFSASCEAMYCSMPVVIHPYPEFISAFGEEQTQGSFLPTEHTADLVFAIRELGNDQQKWTSKARAARKAVEPFTWEVFAKQLLRDLRTVVR